MTGQAIGAGVEVGVGSGKVNSSGEVTVVGDLPIMETHARVKVNTPKLAKRILVFEFIG